MKSGKGNQEEEEEDAYEDFVTRKDAPPPTNNTKDGKNSNKANAVRSKHSVTEQRRRSKINERAWTIQDTGWMARIRTSRQEGFIRSRAGECPGRLLPGPPDAQDSGSSSRELSTWATSI
ncbi:uncharacterized protein LOC142547041 isoform X1 [Primulina tabacum]|uniref:uncharacterized protein LOC142547041 isoform X1 n=1 Tax=Primulina tabacum TaxID=48773 RepID=UPI003F59CF24